MKTTPRSVSRAALAVLVTGSALLGAGPALAERASVFVNIGTPGVWVAPAPVVVAQAPVWVEGHYVVQGGRRHWVDGHWRYPDGVRHTKRNGAWGDRDGDGVPNRYDSDRNGDGRIDPRLVEPRFRDTDGDGLPDINDRWPNNPRQW